MERVRKCVALFLPRPADRFAKRLTSNLKTITPEQALKHPTWNMGPKITIDSATLFNKGLEMIEAHWLFGVEMKRVEVVIHPQSIVHSMVEFADGSVLAQLSHSNMCFPIQYAVTWPDRVPNSLPPLDFGKLSKLEFATPRYDDFPALNLARRAGETGGTLPAVLNAANEIAVSAFLEEAYEIPRNLAGRGAGDEPPCRSLRIRHSMRYWPPINGRATKRGAASGPEIF